MQTHPQWQLSFAGRKKKSHHLPLISGESAAASGTAPALGQPGGLTLRSGGGSEEDPPELPHSPLSGSSLQWRGQETEAEMAAGSGTSTVTSARRSLAGHVSVSPWRRLGRPSVHTSVAGLWGHEVQPSRPRHVRGSRVRWEP